MAAGGPGDHPISDVVVYDIEVYGPETDGSLKLLSGLLSSRELYEFWLELSTVGLRAKKKTNKNIQRTSKSVTPFAAEKALLLLATALRRNFCFHLESGTFASGYINLMCRCGRCKI